MDGVIYTRKEGLGVFNLHESAREKLQAKASMKYLLDT